MNRDQADQLCRCLLEFIVGLSVDPHRGFELKMQSVIGAAQTVEEKTDCARTLARTVAAMSMSPDQRQRLDKILARQQLPDLNSLLS